MEGDVGPRFHERKLNHTLLRRQHHSHEAAKGKLEGVQEHARDSESKGHQYCRPDGRLSGNGQLPVAYPRNRRKRDGLGVELVRKHALLRVVMDKHHD